MIPLYSIIGNVHKLFFSLGKILFSGQKWGVVRDAIFFAQGKVQQCYKTDTAGKGFADNFII